MYHDFLPFPFVNVDSFLIFSSKYLIVIKPGRRELLTFSVNIRYSVNILLKVSLTDILINYFSILWSSQVTTESLPLLSNKSVTYKL